MNTRTTEQNGGPNQRTISPVIDSLQSALARIEALEKSAGKPQAQIDRERHESNLSLMKIALASPKSVR